MIKIEGDKVCRLETDGSIFLYKEQNGEDEANVQNEVVDISAKGKMNWKPGHLILRTLEQGIVGWEKVVGEDDKPIEFKKELIKFIPKEIRDQLYELISPTRLTKEEEKNS